MKKPKTSLYVLLARRANKAVIFRRGPSKSVQLINWDLTCDSFEQGQWFKGRVYERRCDLSPDGGLLIYFAATYKEPLRSWTAISKPPWFTALALWPKGDGWNGGGRFDTQYSIHLNHFPYEASAHPDFVQGCRKFPIASLAEYRGEDDTIWNAMLEREGWTHVQSGEWMSHGEVKNFSWKAKVPDVWKKGHPSLPCYLEMSIEGIHKTDGPWYYIIYRVMTKSGEPLLDLGQTDWAEWSKDGDLLFARAGCLYRQTFARHGPQTQAMLADFTPNKFESLKAPEWAQKL